MEKLYAPWRGNYINNGTSGKCVFCCCAQSTNDEENFILKRYPTGMVMLNLYPYNAGHILIVPFTHTAHITTLTAKERFEMVEMASISSAILEQTLNCEGINIGVNIAKSAGGSIPEHIHMHVVPRWTGDTNFLVTTADTKVVPFDLCHIYKKLRAALLISKNV